MNLFRQTLDYTLDVLFTRLINPFAVLLLSKYTILIVAVIKLHFTGIRSQKYIYYR